MGFFNKEKVTTERISKALLENIVYSCDSLIYYFKGTDEKFIISKKQKMEFFIFLIISKIIAADSVFGDSKITQNIFYGIYDGILDRYFTDDKIKNEFHDLYEKRYIEYVKMWDKTNKEELGATYYLSQLFGTYFFKEGEKICSPADQLAFATIFNSSLVSEKQFFDELSSNKFKIV